MKDKFVKISGVIFRLYLTLSVIVLSVGFYYLYTKINALGNADRSTSYISPETKNIFNVSDTSSDSCGLECQKQIKKAVSEAVATMSASRVTISPTTAANTQIVFIPLPGPVTTTSMNWYDVPGTDVYIDLAREYGTNAKVWWDAFLSVANGNGTAYTRLYDATHNIAVNGSELSSVDNAASQQVSSGQLSFWSGRNLYRVQIKSLNSFAVMFTSGRIKISY